MNTTNCIIIYVSVTVQPENKQKFESNLSHIVNMAKQTQGCLKYQWFLNPENNDNYVIYGEFDSDDSFVLYRKSEVVQMIGKELLPLLQDKPSFKHFRAQVFEEG